MEPSAISPRRGTLEDPEVIENVPGHVIPILTREFDDFKTEATRFLDGQIEEDEFIKFRLKQGVYGQRQPDVQMIRVKLPFGGVTPEQLEAFADVVEKYAPLNKGHVTTRQNIQIHHIPLPEIEQAIRELGDAGLSSREGCGNTVRNVTGDPWAGVAEDELFDMTPYAGAYIRYFVRHPTTQAMPRKVKTAFDGSPADRAICAIHDIAFRAKVREIEGRGEVKGAEMLVGGGTSIMPRLAHTLYDFIELDNGDYLKARRGRLPHLRPPGVAARQPRPRPHQGVRGQVRDRRAAQPGRGGAEGRLGRRTRLRAPAVRDRRTRDRAGSPGLAAARPTATWPAFEDFCARNVAPQRQDGYVTVEARITRGDLTPEQFRGLADITRTYTGGYARTTVQQNLLLRWVPEESVYDVWQALSELGLASPGPREVSDVVSCPGTDSCKLGITSSMGLNEAVQERIETMDVTDPLSRQIHIKMSGCPNGCSQHHVADIGLYGASIKVGEHTIPAYIPHIGGNYEDADVVFGQRLKVRLAAKRVPDAIERWIRHYESSRSEGESFRAFAERVGTGEFEGLVKDLSMPVEFGLETMNTFIDWNRDVPFEVIRGEGECAV